MTKFFAVSVLAFASFSAFATPRADISCKSAPGSRMTMTLDAENLYLIGENEAEMSRVVVKMKRDFDGKWETGRARTIEADKAYRPTTYKNSVRFNMSNLVDTKDFGRYMPNDTCIINVIVPSGALKKSELSIPAVINCDQGGGTITLDCTLSNKEND